MKVHALAASAAKAELKPFEFELPALPDDRVDVAVEYCGICHSDISMLDNEWGIGAYPFVPGHEVVGRVSALGRSVKHLQVGQRVGVGWYSGSCLTCRNCMHGDHNLCPSAEQTIVGRFGGFASHVRAQGAWVLPLNEGIDPSKAGPLFCGGLTVFNPIVQFDVRPTNRVGVVGIGGLGHLALQFLNKWGCEVTAFSSSASKNDEIKKMGAHNIVNSRDDAAMAKIAGTLDFILVTVNVNLNWPALLNTLAPKGRLHVVGVVPDPIPAQAFAMIVGQKSISGSPLGSPATAASMLDFCERHGIAPITEQFPMSKANDAIEHLKAGKARYRLVLKNDLPA
jgi:uncharacterized zinc-type alcohol dehydrogenase-like protein